MLSGLELAYLTVAIHKAVPYGVAQPQMPSSTLVYAFSIYCRYVPIPTRDRRRHLVVKRCIVSMIAVLALASCSQAGRPASSARPSARQSTQLSPAQARQVFARFLAAFKQVQLTRSAAAARRLATGPEEEAQNFQPGFVGPQLTVLTDERFYVPRLGGYPRWFVGSGHQRGTSVTYL